MTVGGEATGIAEPWDVRCCSRDFGDSAGFTPTVWVVSDTVVLEGPCPATETRLFWSVRHTKSPQEDQTRHGEMPAVLVD